MANLTVTHKEIDKKHPLDGYEGAAVIFVRRRATYGIGHVGWGFLILSGERRRTDAILTGDGNLWEIGAVENHRGWLITPPLKDGYWCKKTSEPLQAGLRDSPVPGLPPCGGPGKFGWPGQFSPGLRPDAE